MFLTTDYPYDETVANHGGDDDQGKTDCPEYIHQLGARQVAEMKFRKSIKSFKSRNIKEKFVRKLNGKCVVCRAQSTHIRITTRLRILLTQIMRIVIDLSTFSDIGYEKISSQIAILGIIIKNLSSLNFPEKIYI